MSSIKDTVKNFLKNLEKKFSNAEQIENDEDYHRTEKWVKKTQKSYKKTAILGTIIASILTVVLISTLLRDNGWDSFGVVLLGGLMLLIYLPTFILAGWGHTTMKMHSKEVRKAAWKAAKYGYQIGETIKTKHVDISHEFGNTYKVSSRTEDKGLLFACIAMICIMAA